MFDAIAEKERMVVRLGRDHIVVKHYDLSLNHVKARWRTLSRITVEDASPASIIETSSEHGKLADAETNAFSDRAFEVANAAV